MFEETSAALNAPHSAAANAARRDHAASASMAKPRTTGGNTTQLTLAQPYSASNCPDEN